MDYNKLIEYRKIIRERIDEIVPNDNFELSIKMLTTIHEELFKGILYNNGHFRHHNLSREEEILNLDSVTYPDYHTIPAYLKFAIRDQEKINYTNLDIEEVIENIAKFTSEIWHIHPFSDGNTRTTAVFIEKYLRALGYNIDNEVFRDNTKYFRNSLVKANYTNEDLEIDSDYEPLIKLFRKVLIDKNIELNDDELIVKELFNKPKKKKKIFKNYN